MTDFVDAERLGKFVPVVLGADAAARRGDTRIGAAGLVGPGSVDSIGLPRLDIELDRAPCAQFHEKVLC